MKRSVLVVAVLAFSTLTAAAADLAPRPYTKAPAIAVDSSYDWSGFYVGGHVGYLWGRTRLVDDGGRTEAGAPTDGVVGGLLAGYNWQFSGPLVVGIEADIGWTNAHGIGSFQAVTTPNSYDIRWTSHAVGKGGYASGSWFFFATGGVSIADLNVFMPQQIPSMTCGGIYTGFSVGAGVEYALNRNLLVRLQYIYDDFGSKSYVMPDGGRYDVSLISQTLRGALSWKF